MEFTSKEKAEYEKGIKEGFSPMTMKAAIEKRRKRQSQQQQRKEEYVPEEERAYLQAKENISKKYNKIKAVVGEIKAEIPQIATKKAIVKTGRFVAGAILLAPSDIRKNLQRNKDIKTAQRKAYIKRRKEELSLRKAEIDIRKQERKIHSMPEDPFKMNEFFNVSKPIEKKKRKGSNDPLGLSGFY